jgi:hypothetical protein
MVRVIFADDHAHLVLQTFNSYIELMGWSIRQPQLMIVETDNLTS